MVHIFTKLKFPILLIFTFLCLGTMSVKAADVAKGEALYKQHCTACHKLSSKLVGPQLKGITAKYKDDKEWLYKWIKNNQALIKSGDPKAVALYEANGKQQMNVFGFLTDADIADILEFTDKGEDPGEPPVELGTGLSDAGNNWMKDPSIYYSLLGVAGLLVALMLFLVFGTAGLAAAVRAKDEGRELKGGDVWNEYLHFLKNKFVMSMIIVVVLVGGTVKLIEAARGVSLHPGYMPTQPIAYSHKLHAGTHKIECQYCHSGASKSKNAWIPSTNVCMNCHKAVEKGPEHGKLEIAKIYMSAGWHPIDKKYFAANTSADTIEAVFKKWLNDEKKATNLNVAYEEITSKVGFQKPIEWVRVHNLPDHAYFNHAQHIGVGGKDKDGKDIYCQTCHGPIENMEVVYQHEPLSMGWCINCHRDSKTHYSFQVTDPKNPSKKTSVTPSPADMGGLDCAKCHY